MEKNSEELRKMEDFFFSPTEIGTRKLKLGKKKKAGCLLQGHFHLGGGRDLLVR